MTTERVVTLFPALGPDGQHRAARIQAITTQLGYRYREERRYTVRAGLQAQLCDDVAIYDLSGNDDSNGPYRALASTYSRCDHVLLISKDYLPANLLPARAGGAPPYPYPVRELPDGRRIDFPTQGVRGEELEEWVPEDDHSMLTWLRHQLSDLASGPAGNRLPRGGSEDVLWPASSSALRFVSEDLQLRPMHQDSSTAFVSYRGQYYTKALRLAQEALACGDAGDDVRKVRVVGPAEFALDGELMSAGRRWMVFQHLGMLIRAASQLWALRTEDYLQSWWTISEIVYAAIARESSSGLIPSKPQIRVLDPVSGRLTDDATDLDVSLSKRDIRKFTDIALLGIPGGSSTAHPTMPSSLRRPPKGASPRRTWQSFWNDLLIDRRAVDDDGRSYAPSHADLLTGISAMTVVDPVRAAVAVTEGEAVVAEDGSRWRLAELPPRILYKRPFATRPRAPVLTRVKTFHVL